MKDRLKTRQRSRALLKKLIKPTETGNQNSPYHVMNAFSAFIQISCNHSWETAQGWIFKGLRVCIDDIVNSPHPFICVTYQMLCGKLVFTIIPKMKRSQIKSKLAPVRSSIDECWIPFDRWHECTIHMDDLIENDGSEKSLYYSFKG